MRVLALLVRQGGCPEEIAQLEADSVRIDDGVNMVKAGIMEIRAGLFGDK